MKNAMQRLNDLMQKKNSRVCAGLDVTWEGIPEAFKAKFGWDDEKGEENMEDFSQIIYKYCEEYIDAVADIVPAIKMNSAFFEREHLEDLYLEVARYAEEKGLFVIGDLKRADIGSTSKAYAEAFLSAGQPFDAITINPYFGTDGVKPFIELAKEYGKGIFVLVKTSNKSSAEIQDLKLADGRKVYDAVADLVVEWAEKFVSESLDEFDYPDYPMVGAVVGATHPKEAEKIVDRMGRIFCLVPGYGAQGATADDVAVNFDEDGLGAIVNSSRGIMQAYQKDCWKDKYSEETWAEAARAEAIRATQEINEAIDRYWNKIDNDIEVCDHHQKNSQFIDELVESMKDQLE